MNREINKGFLHPIGLADSEGNIDKSKFTIAAESLASTVAKIMVEDAEYEPIVVYSQEFIMKVHFEQSTPMEFATEIFGILQEHEVSFNPYLWAALMLQHNLTRFFFVKFFKAFSEELNICLMEAGDADEEEVND